MVKCCFEGKGTDRCTLGDVYSKWFPGLELDTAHRLVLPFLNQEAMHQPSSCRPSLAVTVHCDWLQQHLKPQDLKYALFYHWWELPQVWFLLWWTCLSRQTCVCHDKTHLLLWRKYACCNSMLVVTKLCLSRHTFITTKDMFCMFVMTKMKLCLTEDAFCHDKRMFVMTNTCFVMTKMILVAAPTSDAVLSTCIAAATQPYMGWLISHTKPLHPHALQQPRSLTWGDWSHTQSHCTHMHCSSHAALHGVTDLTHKATHALQQPCSLTWGDWSHTQSHTCIAAATQPYMGWLISHTKPHMHCSSHAALHGVTDLTHKATHALQQPRSLTWGDWSHTQSHCTHMHCSSHAALHGVTDLTHKATHALQQPRSLTWGDWSHTQSHTCIAAATQPYMGWLISHTKPLHPHALQQPRSLTWGDWSHTQSHCTHMHCSSHAALHGVTDLTHKATAPTCIAAATQPLGWLISHTKPLHPHALQQPRSLTWGDWSHTQSHCTHMHCSSHAALHGVTDLTHKATAPTCIAAATQPYMGWLISHTKPLHPHALQQPRSLTWGDWSHTQSHCTHMHCSSHAALHGVTDLTHKATAPTCFALCKLRLWHVACVWGSLEGVSDSGAHSGTSPNENFSVSQAGLVDTQSDPWLLRAITVMLSERVQSGTGSWK